MEITMTTTNEMNRSAARQTRLLPPVDVLESETEVLLVADLPGVSKDHLSVTVEGADLTVSTDGDDVPHYHRAFRVPDVVDSEAIGADLRDGVLLIHMPKVPAAQPRRVAVQSA